MHQEDDLVLAIVETVAERDGVDVTELEEPLHDIVDTEALAALLTTASGDVSVTFSYAGYSIRVDGNGVIRVSATAPDSSPTPASV